MFLTVAMPVYNSGKYLSETIDSILCQSENDYEIILVDDGSTDDSPILCEEYVRKHPDKIRMIKKNNAGSLQARRTCFLEAKGDYVYVMDSDDKLINPDAFKIIKETICIYQADMVIFVATKDSISYSPYHEMPFENNTIFEGDELKKIYRQFVVDTSMNSLWNKVFKRSLIDFADDYTKYTDIINGTDVFQVLPIVTNAKRIVLLQKVFYYYRTVNGSIGRKFNPLMYNSIKANSFRLEKYLRLWGIDNENDIKELFYTKRLSGCTTAVNRIRFLNRNLENKRIAISYIKEICNDEYFLNVLSYKNKLPIQRRLLAIMMQKKMSTLIWILYRFLK